MWLGMKMLDHAITGGTIIDGSGAPAFRGDIGIKDGLIVEIGELEDSASETLSADGLIVSGFVDRHTPLPPGPAAGVIRREFRQPLRPGRSHALLKTADRWQRSLHRDALEVAPEQRVDALPVQL
jgi:cytosine/adenosine deaminase-related metal-dependent hydrolase